MMSHWTVPKYNCTYNDIWNSGSMEPPIGGTDRSARRDKTWIPLRYVTHVVDFAIRGQSERGWIRLSKWWRPNLADARHCKIVMGQCFIGWAALGCDAKTNFLHGREWRSHSYH